MSELKEERSLFYALILDFVVLLREIIGAGLGEPYRGKAEALVRRAFELVGKETPPAPVPAEPKVPLEKLPLPTAELRETKLKDIERFLAKLGLDPADIAKIRKTVGEDFERARTDIAEDFKAFQARVTADYENLRKVVEEQIAAERTPKP